MIQAVKLVRSQQNPFLNSRFPSSFSKTTAAVQFPQAKFVFTRTESLEEERMSTTHKQSEKNQNVNEKDVDAMTHSFGEAYSTRSEEEGFGGIYGGNQRLRRSDDEEKVFPEVHQGFETTQGHEVTEKEKSRNQTNEPTTKPS